MGEIGCEDEGDTLEDTVEACDEELDTVDAVEADLPKESTDF